MIQITDVSNMVRSDIVPYYTYLIITNASGLEVKRMNDLILSKWSKSGLLYIKERAWKAAEKLGYTFETGWGSKTLCEVHNVIQQMKLNQ